MADTAGVTPSDDSPKPLDGPAEAAPRKPLNNSWLFPVAGGLFGVYFLVSGALMIREKHGNGPFALLMAAIVVVVAAIAVPLYRTYRAQRAARR